MGKKEIVYLKLDEVVNQYLEDIIQNTDFSTKNELIVEFIRLMYLVQDCEALEIYNKVKRIEFKNEVKKYVIKPLGGNGFHLSNVGIHNEHILGLKFNLKELKILDKRMHKLGFNNRAKFIHQGFKVYKELYETYKQGGIGIIKQKRKREDISNHIAGLNNNYDICNPKIVNHCKLIYFKNYLKQK